MTLGSELVAQHGAQGVSNDSNAPLVVEHKGTNLAMPITVDGWHDIAPLSSPTALDLVFANCHVNQWIRVAVDALANTTAAYVNLDMWTIVAGVPVNQFGEALNAGNNGGVPAWAMPTSEYAQPSGPRDYQLKAGDISVDGTVRVRLRAAAATTVARSLLGVAGFSIRLTGTGPFG